ncbi:aminotransferase class IV [Desulfoscipio sp. XC116]|uniref:aminotransferase class IV n=1 Tax=Desulfoscipio sp. XC116 TaxID=3144975 RepID=UPI00325B5AE0
MQHYFLCDGELKPAGQFTLHPRDQGLLYGFSLFETMLVKQGRIIMLRQHVQRLAGSAAALGVTVAADGDLLVAGSMAVVKQSGAADGVLRLTVTAGSAEGEPGLIFFSIQEGVPYPPGCYARGFLLLTLGWPRNEKSPLVRHKTANYLENILGRREALRLGYDEGIFLNSLGNVAEGTVSNVFVVRQGELLTPPPGAGLLPGTVRQLILELAPAAGYRCREGNFITGDILSADECFVTNSLMGVMPVTGLDGKKAGGGRPGRITMELMKHQTAAFLS